MLYKIIAAIEVQTCSIKKGTIKANTNTVKYNINILEMIILYRLRVLTQVSYKAIMNSILMTTKQDKQVHYLTHVDRMDTLCTREVQEFSYRNTKSSQQRNSQKKCQIYKDIIWQSQNGCLAAPHEVSNRH